MWETLAIIASLGGLELVLWLVDRRRQERQLDVLESILTELTLHNAREEEDAGSAT